MKKSDPVNLENSKENKNFIGKLKGPHSIPSSSRRLLLITFAVILAGSLLGTFWSISNTAGEEVEETVYYYIQEALIDYSVYTLPNDLFANRMLGPGRAYIAGLTDYIALDFEYRFFGEREAAISGEYDATATLAAYTAQEEHLVWEKVYQVLPRQYFSVNDSELTFTERIIVPFSDYLAFTEYVKDETGYSPSELKLTVNCNVSMSAETEEGVISEKLAPGMIIPLNGNTFTVDGTLAEELEGGITQTRVVTGTGIVGLTLLLPVMILLSALALTFVRFATVSALEGQKKEVPDVSSLLKKHGDRIITTANGVSSIPEGAVVVVSFEELLKLADEIDKPILYPRPAEGSEGDHYFLIFTPEKVYAYGISGSKVSEANK
jgi:hypothetical protein